MGRKLAGRLTSALQKMDESRADLAGELAQQAGIDTSTMNAILRGEINCPPIRRLEAFAEVLGVSTRFLVAAARDDGCTYGEDE